MLPQLSAPKIQAAVSSVQRRLVGVLDQTTAAADARSSTRTTNERDEFAEHRVDVVREAKCTSKLARCGMPKLKF